VVTGGFLVVILYAATLLLLLASLWASPERTAAALRAAGRQFLKVAPAFVFMLVCVAVALYLVPEALLTRLLAGENKWAATASAAAVGSISVMPGFIAFPLCGILLREGALYMVLSAFSTTLMMVGIATFPLERTYLGARLALTRNLVSLGIALLVAIVTGFVFGELP
jgi:uncharacterized membrane protein YraQ (UPF0718 family)